MTRKSIEEYAAALRPRYQAAGKRAKGAILDEFCRTTGYHRKAAIRLLGRSPTVARRPAGRPRVYGAAVQTVLVTAWEASGHLCGKRLAPFLPELVAALERHGAVQLEPAVRTQLVGLSAATIDRLLAPQRRTRPRPGGAHTPASAAFRAQVPVRTFGEWAAVTPGAGQADLVLHCGDATEGFFLATLVLVDVASGWTELAAVWGKGKQRVGAALHHAQQRLPLPLRELHTDNGGEFLNEVVTPWCRREGIHVTRGRPYKKNDQAYVEQKNGAVVRHLVGYDRYASKAAYAQLASVYALLRLWVNYFQPLRRLVRKEREGAKVRKVFDQAQTPYQRLLVAGVLTLEQQQRMAAEYQRLNPIQLRQQLDAALARLWALAERPRGAGDASPAPPQ